MSPHFMALKRKRSRLHIFRYVSQAFHPRVRELSKKKKKKKKTILFQVAEKTKRTKATLSTPSRWIRVRRCESRQKSLIARLDGARVALKERDTSRQRKSKRKKGMLAEGGWQPHRACRGRSRPPLYTEFESIDWLLIGN